MPLFVKNYTNIGVSEGGNALNAYLPLPASIGANKTYQTHGIPCKGATAVSFTFKFSNSTQHVSSTVYLGNTQNWKSGASFYNVTGQGYQISGKADAGDSSVTPITVGVVPGNGTVPNNRFIHWEFAQFLFVSNATTAATLTQLDATVYYESDPEFLLTAFNQPRTLLTN